MATRQAQSARVRRRQTGVGGSKHHFSSNPKRPRSIEARPNEGWHREGASTTREAARVIDRMTAAMLARDYAEKDVFAMRLALEEAVINAIKHGHKGNLTKWVQIRYQVSDGQAVAVVQDEGPGFHPEQVPNPLDAENLERPSGRGLLLMRAYLTWMWHNERGNIVTLCKRRTR